MLLIENAIYLDAQVDLLIDEGRIVTMTPGGHCPPPAECEHFDAQGLLLFPSLIDAHTHLREPGQEYKEDIASGLSAAAHGGFGALMCMANTKPVNDNAAITVFMKRQAQKSHPFGPALYPVAAATMGLEGQQLAPLAELHEAGCKAVSNDGRPLASSEILRRVMEYAADLDMILIDHCEDPHLAKGWLMNEGPLSGKLGVKGQPWAGEAIQVARDILMAEYLNLPIHIAHVSSKASLELIAAGKARGVRVTAETCPHYLLLDESAIADYNTNAKVSPPLRSPEDREALRQAVRDGTIDILVTDHAPHAEHEKNDTLDNAPCGFTGLDTAMSLSWQLVREGVISERRLHDLWCRKTAQIFHLPFNEFNPGNPADFFLFDPNVEWRVTAENLYSKSANTPWLNQILTGKVRHHWLGGKQLF